MYTLPETNSSHLKMDGWNTIVFFWDGLLYFQVRAVSFRECIIQGLAAVFRQKRHWLFGKKTDQPSFEAGAMIE